MAAILHVDCPYCGARKGQHCRNARTGARLPLMHGNGKRSTVPNICRVRRLAYQDFKRQAFERDTLQRTE